MLTQIIRTIVMTATREITRDLTRTALLSSKPRKQRNSYYRGR